VLVVGYADRVSPKHSSASFNLHSTLALQKRSFLPMVSRSLLVGCADCPAPDLETCCWSALVLEKSGLIPIINNNGVVLEQIDGFLRLYNLTTSTDRSN